MTDTKAGRARLDSINERIAPTTMGAETRLRRMIEVGELRTLDDNAELHDAADDLDEALRDAAQQERERIRAQALELLEIWVNPVDFVHAILAEPSDDSDPGPLPLGERLGG